MYKLFQVMKMEENVCITTYFNAFDSKMVYILRDKDPKTLRDAFKIDVNIENNRRTSRKLGRRDDPNIFNLRNNKRDGDKLATNKRNEEDKIDQVIGLLKNINPQGLKNINKFSRQKWLQNFSYNTNWKDGQPIVPPAKTTNDKIVIMGYC